VSPALVNDIKVVLDELRMQMLGLQVLFGFQLQGLFQAGFDSLTPAARVADAAGLIAMVLALGLLVGIPCQHRIVERGESTLRLFKAAKRAANVSLLPLAVGIGCDVLVATSFTFGLRFAAAVAALAVVTALIAWYGLPQALRLRMSPTAHPVTEAKAPLHAKIEQMLTEARVVLPGSQALLGFQMVVMLTPTFNELSGTTRHVHIAALLLDMLSVILLICPAAIHRMTFKGQDDARMHTIGSVFVTLALGPLALSVAADLYVAFTRLFDDRGVAIGFAIAMLCFMVACWYVVPLAIRKRVGSAD
jgi:hypothetical protein